MSTPAVALTPDARLRQATVKKRFRWQFAAAAVVVMVIAALLAGYLVNLLQTQNTVIILRANVERGKELTAADLGSVTIGVISGVAVVPANQISAMVGRRAASDLTKGSLLNPAAVTDRVLPVRAKSLAGLRLTPGRVIAGDLRPGNIVRLIELPPANDNPTTTTQSTELETWRAVVVSTFASADGSKLLDVELDSNVADRVSRLAAQDLITVVQDSSE